MVDNGFLDTAGRPTPLPDACHTEPSADCLSRHGIAATYSDYQTADRLLTFHLTETGLFLAAALVLITVTLIAMRRTGRR